MARASLRELFVPAVLNHACYRRAGAWAGLWNVVGEEKSLQGWSDKLEWGVNTNMDRKDIGCDCVHWVDPAVDRDK